MSKSPQRHPQSDQGYRSFDVTYGDIKKPMALGRLRVLMSSRGFIFVQRKIDGHRGRGWIIYQRDMDKIASMKRLLTQCNAQYFSYPRPCVRGRK